jgi:phytoene synthase
LTALATAPVAAARSPADIVAASGSNFLAGFVCLDAERRAGMTAIYAFCRVADDAVDEAPDPVTGARHLEFWRAELAAATQGAARTPVGAAVQVAMQRYAVPAAPLADLLDGVATDLAPRPFVDEVELHRYCYRVAAAVGLACLPVLGATSAGAQEFADALGHALQRTNILRDVRADAEGGRCYVPTAWLNELAVERDWLRGRGPDAVYAPGGAVARLSERWATAARAQFARADAALRRLPQAERRALVPARIMGAVYRVLLDQLERRGGELRLPRVRVPRWRKLACLVQGLLGIGA